MSKITSSSTAEYFAKNLQQVGFSSPSKAVLTTLKEAVDNSLDACEENEILPEIRIEILDYSTSTRPFDPDVTAAAVGICRVRVEPWTLSHRNPR